MSIFEYDEKLHEKTLLEIGREEGLQQGIQQGMQQGIQQGIQGAVVMLRNMGCTEEEIEAKLTETYGLDLAEIRSLLDKG